MIKEINKCLESLIRSYSKLENCIYKHNLKTNQVLNNDLDKILKGIKTQKELIYKHFHVCNICNEHHIQTCKYTYKVDNFITCYNCNNTIHINKKCCIMLNEDFYFCNNKKCLNEGIIKYNL